MSFQLNQIEMQRLLQVGVHLSSEKDLTTLLSIILTETKMLLKAQAASLFLVVRSGEKEKLRFMLALNDEVHTPFEAYEIEIDEQSLAGYVAKTRCMLRIADVYALPDTYPFVLNRSFDEQTGFRSQSLLSVPLIDHKDHLIGVIQIWNKKSSEGSTDSFTIHDEVIALSLAGQAAVALENSLLYEEIQKLFEGFIKASVHAIESRDPTTSGHSERVADLTCGLARAVNDLDHGPFQNIRIVEEAMREIRYASLLHDFGKIGVREDTLTKSKKLFPLELELVLQKFESLAHQYEIDYLKKKMEFLKLGYPDHHETVRHLELEYIQKVEQIRRWREIVLVANEPTVLPQDIDNALFEIRDIPLPKRFAEPDFIINREQWDRLNIRKGSLSPSERLEIESHVSHTYQFLKRIPWTSELKNVPEIAYAHHEKLQGSGYPRRLEKTDIPLPAQMMAIADIYDALVARDRPYKKAIEPREALRILRAEAHRGDLNQELLALFVDQKIYLRI